MSVWSDAVAATSPYLWWKLDETSGTVAADSSGNGRHGDYSATSDTTRGLASLIPGDPASSSVKFNTNTASVGKTSGISYSNVPASFATTYKSATNETGDMFYGDNTTGPFLRLAGSYSEGHVDGFTPVNFGYDPTALCDGNAHLIVWVIRATSTELWVDGVMVGSGSHSVVPTTITRFNVSRAFSGPAGQYDDALMWTTALSAAQVDSLWDAWSAAAPAAPSASLAGTEQRDTGTVILDTPPSLSLAGASRDEATFTLDAAPLATLAGVGQRDVADVTLTADLAGYVLTGTEQRDVAAFAPFVHPTTDTTNRVGGRTRGGYGRAEWSPAVVAVPSGLDQGHAVVSAHAYGAVTMRGAQPTFTVSEASKPRDRQRILIGGQDVTFFRGAPTPEAPYQLADPLLWGPATIELPQIAAAFEKPGAKPLKWLRFGANVVIQRVNAAGKVTATDYRGVVIAFGANGGALTVECGGQAQGRAALRDRQVPIFQFVHDVGWYAWTAIASLGLQLSPRGGPDTGIEFGRSGGMSHLDYIRDLCGRAQTKSGKRWTIMPNDAGVYRMAQKDTTTVDATIFCDDARAVANLRRDMAEEPNRIFATGVTPEGKRIRFGAYPGLKHGDAPPFPNTDGRAIREGHTNADTDSGDGVSVLRFRLRHTGYLSFDDAPGGYDRDMTRAVRHLQADADLAETGNVNEATWEALFDLNVTGYSLRFAGITPAVERSRVRPWRRAASGAIIARNPNYDRNALKVDRTVDMGTGFWRGQIREWASAELADSTLPNWVGTIEVRTGAVLAGKVAIGATVSAANVMDVRDLRPGMNVWLPQFDGGTLLHVSGIDVRDDSTTLTVDTRARDALEVWEVITRNRETRANPSRAWRGNKASTEIKDSIDIWDEVGGFLYGDVPLVAGWNVVPVVAGQAGTVSKLRLELKESAEFACAVFGGLVSTKRLNHLIEHPLTKAGTEKWEKRAVRKVLEDRGILYSAGTHEEPCGYSPGRKTNDEGNRSGHPLRGVHRDDASFSYLTPPGRPILYLAVWVGSPNTLKRGRVMWPQLEAAV